MTTHKCTRAGACHLSCQLHTNSSKYTENDASSSQLYDQKLQQVLELQHYISETQISCLNCQPLLLLVEHNHSSSKPMSWSFHRQHLVLCLGLDLQRFLGEQRQILVLVVLEHGLLLEHVFLLVLEHALLLVLVVEHGLMVGHLVLHDLEAAIDKFNR